MDNLKAKMRVRVLQILDPENPYSQEDFNKEFAGCGNPHLDSINKIPFKFANKSSNPDPEYATDGSSGFDLRASLTAPISIESGEVAIIPTGLFFEIPENLEIQVRPRSGLAAKNGVTVLNSPGTVDEDYRGEVKVVLINHGKYKFDITNNDRIAQAVISTVIGKRFVTFNKVDDVSTDTTRGSGGFGSTGIK